MSYYDEIARGYEELHAEEQQSKINLIKQHFVPGKDKKLLDVGCGTGLTTVCWPCEAYGIDPAPKLLERARKGAVYKRAAAESIPFQDSSFDVVTSITALQNFHDLDTALHEIRRVGKDFFILSFLKRSPRRNEIMELITKYFRIEKEIEEAKDIIIFCSPKDINIAPSF